MSSKPSPDGPPVSVTLRVDLPTAAEFLGADSADDKATTTGTHRVAPLEHSLRRLQGVARVVGLTRTSDVTGLDHVGIPVFNSVRPEAADGNLTVTSGKGLTPLAARVSAMAEAVERYCGEPRGREGLWAALTVLRAKGVLALDPRLLRVDPAAGYEPATELEWWPTRELTSGAEVLVPMRAVFVPYLRPPPLCASTSNGLAAGNTVAEATLHALLELVERDCSAFFETLVTGPVVDVDTLPTPARELVTRLTDAGLEVRIRLMRTELGIPAFNVVIDDPWRDDPMLINNGAGCHLDPAVGVARALTEAAQSRLAVISGAREDLAEHLPSRLTGYAAVRDELGAWFAADETVSFADIPDLSTSTISGDIHVLCERLAAAGMRRIFLARLDPPEVGFPVVRAVVPGLELVHGAARLVGPRLARHLAANGGRETC